MSQRDAHISQLDLQPMRLTIGGERRIFDILDPQLPDWLKHTTLPSGNYPHKKKLKMRAYEETLENLQEELVKLQAWLQETGERIVILFEGRDAAGKGGTISAFRRYLNPRWARNVALSKPTETERHQWYYQRYVVHFPTAGEIVTFDRSWYNRAGVEPVMGFCTPEQHAKFLDDTPHFERMISDEGIRLFKIWLNVGREMQLKRFHDRVHSRLKYWKFSSIDVAGIHKWDSYTQHRDTMLEHTHSTQAPWIIVRSNDKRRARIAVVRRVLQSIDYRGRNLSTIGDEDPLVIGEGMEFFDP